MNTPQVKICGITTSEQAVQCARLGAEAVGLVFYEKSPRNVSQRQAARIAQSIDGLAVAVGVTVDMDVNQILTLAMVTGITTFQLHGSESNDYIRRIQKAGLRVIKHLDATGDELLRLSEEYNCFAYLVECGKGALPGGNRSRWNWHQAKPLAGKKPFILAGGLDYENVSQAAKQSNADAVDVSSSVEAEAGIKDMKLVEKFIKQVKHIHLDREIRKIF